MLRSRIALAFTIAVAVLTAASVSPTPAWSQAPDHLQQVEKRLAEKQAAAEAHRTQMEAVKDPDQLSVEMRKHFQMTEDIMALMLERKKLMGAHAPASGAPPTTPSASPSQPGMGSGPSSGMGSSPMEKEKQMGGMPGGMTGGSMEKGGQMGGMQREMGGMGGMHGGMSGMSGGATTSPSGPGKSQAPSRDMDEMMRRIAEHSAAMEKIQDRTALSQEMLRHQRMLDQMLQLLQ